MQASLTSFCSTFPLILILSGRAGRGFGVEGRVEPLGDESLPDASDGPGAGAQGRDDVLVAVPFALYGIRQEQDSGMGQLSACRLAGGDQVFQAPSVPPRPK